MGGVKNDLKAECFARQTYVKIVKKKAGIYLEILT
jgi:hypothetical protein